MDANFVWFDFDVCVRVCMRPDPHIHAAFRQDKLPPMIESSFLDIDSRVDESGNRQTDGRRGGGRAKLVPVFIIRLHWYDYM